MFFEQGTRVTSPQDEPLVLLIQAFLETKKAENIATGTLTFYRNKLALFHTFCTSQGINLMQDISPATIRQFLLFLQERGNNDGGIHAHFRTVRTFLRWYEAEFEPEGWKNPVLKVKAPKIAIEPLAPVEYETVVSMMNVCGNDLVGKRDRAIMLTLLDSGLRANELLSTKLADYDQLIGQIFVAKGKGRKPRTVFLGEKSRRAVRQYLKLRHDSCPFLWITDSGEKLSYWGLVSEFKRLAHKAKVPKPSIHSFRYFYALTCLRNGMDIFSLQELMGHSDIQVLRRYLKQTENDVREAHRRASPVDNLPARSR